MIFSLCKIMNKICAAVFLKLLTPKHSLHSVSECSLVHLQITHTVPAAI